MKRYHGTQTEHGPAVVVEEENGDCRALDPRHDLKCHSREGFNWSYSGSGTAQLALALAADVLGDDERAQEIYQRLKAKLVVGLPQEGWLLTETHLRAVIEAIEYAQVRTR